METTIDHIIIISLSILVIIINIIAIILKIFLVPNCPTKCDPACGENQTCECNNCECKCITKCPTKCDPACGENQTCECNNCECKCITNCPTKCDPACGENQTCDCTKNAQGVCTCTCIDKCPTQCEPACGENQTCDCTKNAQGVCTCTCIDKCPTQCEPICGAKQRCQCTKNARGVCTCTCVDICPGCDPACETNQTCKCKINNQGECTCTCVTKNKIPTDPVNGLNRWILQEIDLSENQTSYNLTYTPNTIFNFINGSSSSSSITVYLYFDIDTVGSGFFGDYIILANNTKNTDILVVKDSKNKVDIQIFNNVSPINIGIPKNGNIYLYRDFLSSTEPSGIMNITFDTFR